MEREDNLREMVLGKYLSYGYWPGGLDGDTSAGRQVDGGSGEWKEV